MREGGNFEIDGFEEVKSLIDKVCECKISKFHMAVGGLELSVEMEPCSGFKKVEPAESLNFENIANKPKVDAKPISGSVIKSPIVGTFYASPAPDKPAFFKVGDFVKKGDVVFIIESMKLMNDVTSEFDGVVTRIFVESGQTVEYGQPIMELE